ncbi:hypothetical protein E2C01_028073 [Portunus trituberculatus]|uniref:Uncharacterized protein n=1 Tax=Portunus trituberculatus TaxID=210409 RepID=A0A5B7EQM5_PORTR|nr:hypothetical protein [Portunus trituberculatus]
MDSLNGKVTLAIRACLCARTSAYIWSRMTSSSPRSLEPFQSLLSGAHLRLGKPRNCQSPEKTPTEFEPLDFLPALKIGASEALIR